MNTLKIFFVFAILFCSFSVLSVSAESWKRAFATILEERDVNVTKRDTGAQITFYQGNDLLNSACYGRNGLPSYNAKPTDMIAAMWMDDMEMCYKCLQIKNGHKTIVVKCIDKCAGCPPGGNNVDLTISAFKKLADPNLGRVAIKWRGLLKCPANGKWPEFEEKKH